MNRDLLPVVSEEIYGPINHDAARAVLEGVSKDDELEMIILEENPVLYQGIQMYAKYAGKNRMRAYAFRQGMLTMYRLLRHQAEADRLKESDSTNQ